MRLNSCSEGIVTMRLLELSARLARRSVLAISLLSGGGAAGCGAGSYVWVDHLGDAATAPSLESAYLIAAGDLLNIRVYDQDAVSSRARVSPDGKITLPLVGELLARGQTPSALARQIEIRLKPFIVAPSAAITVEEAQPLKVSIVGEVVHPGVFPITPGTGVIPALALAGGITEYASHDGIFVLRPRAAKGVLRVRLAYDDLTRGVGRGQLFVLQSGDTVVVE